MFDFLVLAMNTAPTMRAEGPPQKPSQTCATKWLCSKPRGDVIQVAQKHMFVGLRQQEELHP